MRIGTTKKKDIIEHINIINANFKDTLGQTYELSSS